MARRTARDEKPNKPTPTPAAATVAGSSAPTPTPIAFRAFDPVRVDAEFVSAESQVQTAVEHYESAKTVSQRVLEARVCV